MALEAEQSSPNRRDGGALHILIEPRARRPRRFFGQIIERKEPRFGNLVIALLRRRLLEIQNFEQHDICCARAD
jgi:hypothetical protein